MNRMQASTLTRQLLDDNGLKGWGVRISVDPTKSFLGMCSYKDKVIIINAHHVDINPDGAVINTIKHEVAHALTPGHNHDDVWREAAQKMGCEYISACGYSELPESVIDAIRSGANIEMTIETETQVIHRPKYKITQLKDLCPDCGKPAVEKFSFETIDKENGDTIKLITLTCFHIIKKRIPRGTAFDTMVSNDWKPEVKNCKHDWHKNQCKNCKEYKLYNFQVTGALCCERGLATQKGFGIFDDMGLGKTVQGLAIPKFHMEYTPFLVVTKSAITYQWFKQVVRWLGPNYLPQIIRTGRDVLLPGLKTYIVPYDLLRRMDLDKFKTLGLKLVLLDECQQIKNVDSTRTQMVRKLVADTTIKVVPLSGTPWKNRGSEFFPVLNMMDPIKFHSNQAFLDTWVDYYFVGPKRKQGGIRNIPKFKEYTESMLIRREYNEVMDEFPDINRMKLNIQLDELAQSSYDDAESDFVKWYNDKIIGGEEDSVNGMEILAQLARARHITGLAKIPATLGYVEEFVEDTDKKLVIFVHHKDVGELMYKALRDTDKEANPDYYELAKSLAEQKIPVLKYTSDLNDLQRSDMQETFNKSPRAIMIASTLACGEGVDLQTCSDSILHERQWNPQNEDQATPGRFRRIGQVSNVINITLPEAEGTVDEDLDIIVAEKRAFFHRVHNQGEVPQWSQNDIAKQLAERIVAKHKSKNKGKTNKTSITNAAKIVKRPNPMVSLMIEDM